jgi:hypothetical protein
MHSALKIKNILVVALVCIVVCNTAIAQKRIAGEKYGNTLNLGLGIGYYGYIDHSTPVFHLNYEFPVAKDFTLAPFVTFYSYRHNNYRQTVIPVGVKGTYYFDQILNADKQWDFYLGGSLGAAIIKTRWDDGYTRKLNNNEGAGPLYLDLHIGTEYHFNNKIGAFLDLSTGVSTIGLSFH